MTNIKSKRKLNFIIPMGIGGVFLLFLPFFSGPYYTHIFILVFLNVTLAMGYRLMYVTGLVSFAHVSFFGIGAYTSALLAIRLGLPIGVCFLVAGIMAAIVAALVAWPAVRTRGPYFFLISFAFWAVMDSVFKHWGDLTGGPGGLKDIPPVMGFVTVMPYYFIGLAFMAVTIFAMYRLDRSRFGAELLAIGDADDLAEVIGINIARHRILAFAIGALFAGFAGSVYAHYMRFISPSAFSMMFTVYILVWCFIGGERKPWGPMAGAVLLTLIAELLRMSGVLQAILYAAALLIVVMTIPHGIVGLVDTLRARLGMRQDSTGDTKLTAVD